MRLRRTSSAIFPSFSSSHSSSTQTERSKPIRRLYGCCVMCPSEFAVISTPSVIRGTIFRIATIVGVGGAFSDVPHFVLYDTLGPWYLALLPQFYSPKCVERVFSAPLCQAALCECARESARRLLKTTSETRLLRHRSASL